MTVRIKLEEWNENIQTLRERSIHSEHPRTREYFLALYDIANGMNASQVAKRTGKKADTILNWVHAFNEGGPDAIIYEHSGGRAPLK